MLGVQQSVTGNTTKIKHFIKCVRGGVGDASRNVNKQRELQFKHTAQLTCTFNLFSLVKCMHVGLKRIKIFPHNSS